MILSPYLLKSAEIQTHNSYSNTNISFLEFQNRKLKFRLKKCFMKINISVILAWLVLTVQVVVTDATVQVAHL